VSDTLPFFLFVFSNAVHGSGYLAYWVEIFNLS